MKGFGVLGIWGVVIDFESVLPKNQKTQDPLFQNAFTYGVHPLTHHFHISETTFLPTKPTINYRYLHRIRTH